MTRRFTFMIMAVVTVAVSCSKHEDMGQEVLEKLYVNSPQTRIQRYEGKTLWNEGDLVSVFYKSDINEKWQYSGNDRSTDGVLTCRRKKDSRNGRIVAVYPYAEGNRLSEDVLSTYIPSVQTCADGSMRESIMSAQSNDNTLNFRFLTGMVALQTEGSAQIRSIEFRPLADEVTTGYVDFSLTDGKASLRSNIQKHSITLLPEDGEVCRTEGIMTFYAHVIPQTFSKGVEFIVRLADGTTKRCMTNETITIDAGCVRTLHLSFSDEFTICMKFTDGTERNNPFAMPDFPMASMITGGMLGPYTLTEHPWQYPFSFFIQNSVSPDSFRITNGGGLKFGGTKGDYILIPPSEREGYVLSRVSLAATNSCRKEITDHGPDPKLVEGGEARTSSGVFFLKGTKEGESYRISLKEDTCAGISELKLTYRR